MAEVSFGTDYSAIYDVLYREKDYEAECDMIEAVLARHGGDTIGSMADWGCGTGNHSLRLAARGYDVVGVDMSSAMLDQARKKPAPIGGTARFLLGNVADAEIGIRVDAAIMMFAVLGYQLENDQVVATLRNVRRQLADGGLFIADFWYGPAVLAIRPGDRLRVIREGERETLRAARTSLFTERNRAEVGFDLWVTEGGRLTSRISEVHGMRYYFPLELQLFLSLAGFEMLSLTAFPSLENPAGDSSWNALLVARASGPCR